MSAARVQPSPGEAEEQSSTGSLVESLIAGWPSDRAFDARLLLDEHPELQSEKSVILDLAYEEYCRLTAQGQTIETAQFAERFPTISRSLIHLIEVHRLLADSSGPLAGIADPIWPSCGQTWLNFTLVEDLGRGAFSRVYLAREYSLGNRLVVVKATSLGRQEARTLGKLDHPNIVPVYSVQRDDVAGLTAICMPYRGRRTLLDLQDAIFSHVRLVGPASEIHRRANDLSDVGHSDQVIQVPTNRRHIGRNPVHEALRIGTQLASALGYAHQHGILHCDVKPSNVLITETGEAVLLDFNLALLEDQGHSFIGGTLPYMAPEQLQALVSEHKSKSTKVDERTDIFSLGVTLFEFLFGRHPFGELPLRLPREGVAAHLLDKQRSGAAFTTLEGFQIDRGISAILRRCLEYDPNNRPQTMAELEGLFRRQIRWPRRALRWCRSHRRLVISTVAAVVLGLIAAGGWLYARDPYPIREWRQGEAAYLVGDNRSAAMHLRLAVETDPSLVDARFLLARAHARLTNFESAQEQMARVMKDRGSGRDAAAFGYLVATSDAKKLSDAAVWFDQAVKKGFQSAVVYNNLGRCLTGNKSRWGEAEQALRKAIKFDPDLSAAYHNLARLSSSRAKPTEVPSTEWIEKAIALGPDTAQLRQDAALFYLLCAHRTKDREQREQFLNQVVEQVNHGVNLGLTRREVDNLFLRESDIGPTRKAQWESILERAPDGTTSSRSLLLIDPIDDATARG